MAYRILSLDGGGIRGLISTIVLMRLGREKGLAGRLEGDQYHTGGLHRVAPSLAPAAKWLRRYWK